MNKRLLWVVMASLAVVACGKKEEPKAAAPVAAVNAEEKILNIYNWPDYVAQDMVSKLCGNGFTQRGSITVTPTPSRYA